jgi:Glycine zipper
MKIRRDVGVLTFSAGWLLACAAGCNSPYRADQGALFGGLTGAGLGAVVGNAVGDTGAGAAIGAGVGALSGAAVGASLDDIEARNRAEIAARLGRPAPVGAVTIDDVVAMTRAGVSEDVIVTHVQNHGMVAPLRASDLIVLQQQRVAPRVVQAMQAPPPQPAAYPGPPGVIVEPYAVPPPYYYGPPPYWGPPPYYYRHWPRRRVSWGVAVGG